MQARLMTNFGDVDKPLSEDEWGELGSRPRVFRALISNIYADNRRAPRTQKLSTPAGMVDKFCGRRHDGTRADQTGSASQARFLGGRRSRRVAFGDGEDGQ
jgi:hypothetical protein